MSKKIANFRLRISVIALLVLFSSAVFPAVSVTDDLGVTVTLPSAAKRIISLAPHVTEMIFAIDAGDRLIATVEYSDFPIAAKQVRRIGSYNALDVEAIIALQPDLIIAWRSGNSPLQIEKLQAFGIPVFMNEPRQLTDIPDTIQRLAVLTDNTKQASVLIDSFTQHHASLHERFAKRRPVKLFYEIWHQPLMTINGEHLISDVMRLCGAVNIFSEVPVLAPTVSIESVIQARPDIIITGGVQHSHQQWLDSWQVWSQLPAVATKQLYSINPDLIQRHGPRILQGAELLCRYVEQARKIKYASDESLQVPGTGQ